MRQEAKEIDGADLERAEERKRENELIEEREEELYDLDGKPEFARDAAQSTAVIAAMDTILARQHVVIDELHLPQRELRALEALKAAVDGRDSDLARFLYAEDRRSLLEQALAVLQPELASMSDVGRPFDELLHRVAAMREKLNNLEDAESELEKRPVEAKGEEGDTDAKPKPKPDDDTSLTGPERAIARPKSSLAGPERKEEPRPPSSLTGPAVKESPRPPSSLTGPEVNEPAKPRSSLDGPEVKQAPKAGTTLGDAKEIDEAARKKPWWRRPFGG